MRARNVVERVVQVLLIANQVIQRAELDALALLHAERPGLRSMFLVDSVGQVDAIEAWAQDRSFQGRFEVLLELGIAGQRTGTRTADEARQTAARIAASPVLRLAGIECYEGTTAYCDHVKDRATVQGLMDRVDAIAREAIAQGWFAHEEIILTAGGSAIYVWHAYMRQADGTEIFPLVIDPMLFANAVLLAATTAPNSVDAKAARKSRIGPAIDSAPEKNTTANPESASVRRSASRASSITLAKR